MLTNRFFLRYAHEESICHIPLYYGKSKVSRELSFCLFKVHWVMHTTVRETLLLWHVLFVQKSIKKKVWVFSGQFGKREIKDIMAIWGLG